MRKAENVIIAIILLASAVVFTMYFISIDKRSESVPKDYDDYYTVIENMKIIETIYKEKSGGRLFYFDDGDDRIYVSGTYTSPDGNEYSLEYSNVTVVSSKQADGHSVDNFDEKAIAIGVYAGFLVIFGLISYLYKSKMNEKRKIKQIRKDAQNNYDYEHHT